MIIFDRYDTTTNPLKQCVNNYINEANNKYSKIATVPKEDLLIKVLLYRAIGTSKDNIEEFF